MEKYSPEGDLTQFPTQFPIRSLLKMMLAMARLTQYPIQNQNLLNMMLTMARTLLGAIGILLTAHLACFAHASHQ